MHPYITFIVAFGVFYRLGQTCSIVYCIRSRVCEHTKYENTVLHSHSVYIRESCF
jgi:hypothetical protein